MGLEILHLHTYFLFPFFVDTQRVLESRKNLGGAGRRWIDRLDDWLAVRGEARTFRVAAELGPWRRASYRRLDMDSPAYEEMACFQPDARRLFFDTEGGPEAEHAEGPLLRCYEIPIPERTKVWLEAEDATGWQDNVQVTDLRLFLFANATGIFSIGVEAFQLTAAEALWINESLRRLCPASGLQIREGSAPSRVALVVERGGARETLIEERFEKTAITVPNPPLSKIITELLYFADYGRSEYEPVLDERMIVYTYFAVAPDSAPDGFLASPEYQALLSRFLYVDRGGDGFAYEPDFTRAHMDRQLYRRWAHQGTYYGFTSFSGITATFGTFDCDGRPLREGFLIHHLFNTRYYLMAVAALFYRVTLLDFSQRLARVSGQLHLDQEHNRLAPERDRTAKALRGDFLHFLNSWYCRELANKDEEIAHFAMQCREYRVEPMRREVEEGIGKLDALLADYHQLRGIGAVNRLAALVVVFGAGLLVMGFLGLAGGVHPPLHYAMLILAAVVAAGAITFGFYVLTRNQRDYRGQPRRKPTVSSR